MYAGDAAGNVREPTPRTYDPNIRAGSVSPGTYTPDNRPGPTLKVRPVFRQYDYEVAHRLRKRQGNADGLSRKPDRRPLSDIEEEDDEFGQEVDTLPPRETTEIQDAEDGVTVSVGEFLHRQQVDLEIGDVIAMCIAEKTSLVETELPDSWRKTVENHMGDCGIQWDTGLIPVSLDSRRRAVEMQEKLVTAYTGVHQHMQCNAEKNKRYDGLGLRSKKFQIGQWVLYFNPRKLRGKQMKWCRQYEGPYLIVEAPTSVTAKV